MYSQTLINKITPANNYDIAYEVWELDNGLTIIVHEDDSDPMNTRRSNLSCWF